MDALFRDLEAQADALERAELLGRAEELARAERAGIGLRDRLRAHANTRLRCTLRDGSRLEGAIGGLGTDWVALGSREEGGRYAIVRLPAVAAVEGLGVRADTSPGVLEERMTLSIVLRTIARDRVPVRILTEGGPLTGLIAAVGGDHLDLRRAAVGERTPVGGKGTVIPHDGLLAVVVG